MTPLYETSVFPDKTGLQYSMYWKALQEHSLLFPEKTEAQTEAEAFHSSSTYIRRLAAILLSLTVLTYASVTVGPQLPEIRDTVLLRLYDVPYFHNAIKTYINKNPHLVHLRPPSGLWHWIVLSGRGAFFIWCQSLSSSDSQVLRMLASFLQNRPLPPPGGVLF